MPPKKKSAYQDPPDMPISLTMRYGIQSIFLLVDPLAPFSDITDELIFALRDRYETGLRLRPEDDPQDVPSSAANVHVAYAILVDPTDSDKGWKNLHIQGDETPAGLGLKNNTLVSFVIRRADEADQPVDFDELTWPTIGEEQDEDDLEDEEDELMDVDGEDMISRVDKGKGKAVDNGSD